MSSTIRHNRGRLSMQASIVDLRYKMKDILRALERRETVTILYHGKTKGKIVPAEGDAEPRVTAHPFFGMRADDARPVEKVIDELRGGRFRAL
jgi:antitoxin (DNA-binding transcriptional repressor) of toxin-antitoxin stability system